jgi:hypothetical protein
MISRCDVCEGRKKCRGIGGVMKECVKCKGIGFIKLDEIVKEDKPKRTRRSKEQIELDRLTKEQLIEEA